PEEKPPAEEKKEPEEINEEPKEKPEEAKEPPAPQPIKKKINKMTLAEVEAKLKELQETMGGHDSKYAQQLILRKKLLNSKN
ncbi:hypothetical protein ACFLT2_00520, partial [Acidobacteriota bacterium]